MTKEEQQEKLNKVREAMLQIYDSTLELETGGNIQEEKVFDDDTVENFKEISSILGISQDLTNKFLDRFHRLSSESLTALTKKMDELLSPLEKDKN